ncbi:acylphosphatase [Butyrivibrio fibrisolvens DSM 3071]|jgi:acylphosphatase|uniref:acylphosphatase n=1 Tax=Butyrivibrio fibrisolvens DSM 3071 TaxID=1121131 RepID=A0A1M5YIL7_BUTFI|nr:acylphosphatase [Butyrivibrio fibrisolvens]SHI11867.1 acylphosphatase [Butyrivibrio fibrisolvens DSM 3071]
MIRQAMTFYGDVQGVGFRYTAYHIANSLGLTGYVHNEWDGSVTAQVQGEREEIDLFLAQIGRGRYINIERIEQKNIPLDEDERTFRIE